MVFVSSDACPIRAPSVGAESGNERLSGWGVVAGLVLPGTHPSSDLEFQPHGEEQRAPSSLLLSWNETHAIPN